MKGIVLIGLALFLAIVVIGVVGWIAAIFMITVDLTT